MKNLVTETLAQTGRYCMLMRKVFSKPEKSDIYRRRIIF